MIILQQCKDGIAEENGNIVIVLKKNLGKMVKGIRVRDFGRMLKMII